VGRPGEPVPHSAAQVDGEASGRIFGVSLEEPGLEGAWVNDEAIPWPPWPPRHACQLRPRRLTRPAHKAL